MALFDILAIGAAGWAISKIKKKFDVLAEEEKRKQAEEIRRKNTQCTFEDGISSEEFEAIIRKAAKPIRRLKKIYINEAVVYGTVLTQSGISTWSFQLDFNDYGHITGNYWMTSENDDSSIPERLALTIQIDIALHRMRNETGI